MILRNVRVKLDRYNQLHIVIQPSHGCVSSYYHSFMFLLKVSGSEAWIVHSHRDSISLASACSDSRPECPDACSVTKEPGRYFVKSRWSALARIRDRRHGRLSGLGAEPSQPTTRSLERVSLPKTHSYLDVSGAQSGCGRAQLPAVSALPSQSQS
jgi:hypothetical protein